MPDICSDDFHFAFNNTGIELLNRLSCLHEMCCTDTGKTGCLLFDRSRILISSLHRKTSNSRQCIPRAHLKREGPFSWCTDRLLNGIGQIIRTIICFKSDGSSGTWRSCPEVCSMYALLDAIALPTIMLIVQWECPPDTLNKQLKQGRMRPSTVAALCRFTSYSHRKGLCTPLVASETLNHAVRIPLNLRIYEYREYPTVFLLWFPTVSNLKFPFSVQPVPIGPMHRNHLWGEIPRYGN